MTPLTLLSIFAINIAVAIAGYFIGRHYTRRQFQAKIGEILQECAVMQKLAYARGVRDAIRGKRENAA